MFTPALVMSSIVMFAFLMTKTPEQLHNEVSK